MENECLTHPDENFPFLWPIILFSSSTGGFDTYTKGNLLRQSSKKWSPADISPIKYAKNYSMHIG